MPDMTDIERLAREAGVEANAWKVRNDGWGVNTWHYMAALPNWAKERAPLYTSESVARIVAQARKEALEEAAQIADDVPVHWEHWQTAAAIRAMK